MAEDLILKKSILIDASVPAVWKALTDPALIKLYFYGTNVTSEWKEGNPIYFRGTWEGKEYEDKGVILKVIPEKLFKYNYWSNFSGTEDIPENYANITYELEKTNQGTILTILQDGFKSKEKMEHSDQSWGSVMENMKKLVEQKRNGKKVEN